MPWPTCARCKQPWNANLAVGHQCADCLRFFDTECGDLEGLPERTVCTSCRRKRIGSAVWAVYIGAVLAVIVFVCVWGWCNGLDHAPMVIGR